MFSLMLRQQILLAFRKGGGAMGTLGFYLLIFTLCVFALSPETLHDHALPVFCIALMLANVTGQPLLFEQDDEDGMLEQYLLKVDPLESLIFAKLLGHWMVQLFPILLTLPLLCVVVGVTGEAAQAFIKQLVLLSPSLSALSVITASLTLGSGKGGLLPALIMFPLLMPLVIFASTQHPAAPWILAAVAAITLPVSCYISAALLKSYAS